MASLQHGVRIGAGLFPIKRLNRQVIRLVGDFRAFDALDSLDALFSDFLNIQLAFAAHAHDIGFVPVYPVLFNKLVKAVCIAWFQANHSLSFQFGSFYHIFAEVRPAESVVNEILKALHAFKVCRLRIVGQVSGFPAENPCDCSVSQQLFCTVDYFLHLKSSNLTFLPKERIFSTNSFIVVENFTPSAADTHSTRVRPFSTPM